MPLEQYSGAALQPPSDRTSFLSNLSHAYTSIFISVNGLNSIVKPAKAFTSSFRKASWDRTYSSLPGLNLLKGSQTPDTQPKDKHVRLQLASESILPRFAPFQGLNVLVS